MSSISEINSQCPTCSHEEGVDVEGRCLFRFVAADPSQVVDTSPTTQCRCFCPQTVGERIVRAYFVFADYDKPLCGPEQQLAATIDKALRDERERCAKIADERAAFNRRLAKTHKIGDPIADLKHTRADEAEVIAKEIRED